MIATGLQRCQDHQRNRCTRLRILYQNPFDKLQFQIIGENFPFCVVEDHVPALESDFKDTSSAMSKQKKLQT
jgi:hypothetical protein